MDSQSIKSLSSYGSITEYDKFFFPQFKKEKLINFLVQFGIDITEIKSEQIDVHSIKDIPPRLIAKIEDDFMESPRKIAIFF